MHCAVWTIFERCDLIGVQILLSVFPFDSPAEDHYHRRLLLPLEGGHICHGVVLIIVHTCWLWVNHVDGVCTSSATRPILNLFPTVGCSTKFDHGLSKLWIEAICLLGSRCSEVLVNGSCRWF